MRKTRSVILGVSILTLILVLSIILGIMGNAKIETREVNDEASTRSPETIYVGSGPGNDSATIQGGINLASDGDTVFVWSGTYYENVVIDETLTLTGGDRNTTIIDGGGSGDVILISANYVCISGITVRNGGGSGLDCGIEIEIYSSYDNIVINDCNIIYNKRFGIYLYGSTNSIISNCNVSSNNWTGIFSYGGSSNNTVYECEIFFNGNQGICFPVSNNNIIRNCTLYSNTGEGIWLEYSSNNVIDNCTLHQNREGIHLYRTSSNQLKSCNILGNEMGMYLKESSNNIIQSCSLSNNSCGLTIEYSSNTNVIYHNNFVDNANQSYDECINSWNNTVEGNYWSDYIGSDTDNNWVGDTAYSISGDSNQDNYPLMYPYPVGNPNKPKGYSSIQDAIDDADVGDTIYVWDGTYYENVIINKTIKLIGEDRNNTIIDGNGTGDVVYISADWVNVSGFGVRNGYHGISQGWYSNNTIANCNVYNNSIGIYFHHSLDSRITNCIIYNNSYDGIHLAGPPANCTVTYCDIVENGIYGIYIHYCNSTESELSNYIYHNNFINNTYQANDSCTNHWDNDSVGNYWSDYTGVDDDADGIGDTPYSISGGDNMDNYPLIEPVGTDTIKPKITITGVENNTYYNINVTPVITIFDLNLNTSLITLNGEDFTSGTTITEDGVYILFVQATDKMNNPAQETVTFAIDKIPPTISLILPNNNSVIKPGDIINFNITDDNLWNTSYCVDSGDIQFFSSAYNISTEGWEDGTYNITVYAKDWGINEISKMFTFTIDSVVPEILLIYPSNNSVIPPGTILDFDIHDSHLKSSVYSVHGYPIDLMLVVPRYPLNYPYNISTTDWSDKTCAIVIYANDTAGNEVSKWFVFTIDGTPPTVTIADSSQTTNKNTFTMSWSASEEVQFYEVITDGNTWTNIGIATSYMFTLSKGGNTLYVRGTDLAGNKGTADMITVTYKKPEEKKPWYLIPGFETTTLLIAMIGVCIILLRRRKDL